MAQFVCDRCGCDLESLVDVGTVSIGNTGIVMYGYYVFCTECLDIIRKEFREMRFKAMDKEKHQ